MLTEILVHCIFVDSLVESFSCDQSTQITENTFAFHLSLEAPFSLDYVRVHIYQQISVGTRKFFEIFVLFILCSALL